jgi:hypothetical protein
MRRYAWVSGRLQSLARRIGPIPGETVASPAYLESHGIPRLPKSSSIMPA